MTIRHKKGMLARLPWGPALGAQVSWQDVGTAPDRFSLIWEPTTHWDLRTLPLRFLNICIHNYRKHKVEGNAFSLSDSTQAGVLCVHTYLCPWELFTQKHVCV